MAEEIVHLKNSDGTGFVIPLGTVNLVGVVAKRGMVGCGAFDVTALNNFNYPAAKVRPLAGPSIVTVNDLLEGIVKESNPAAQALGIATGMRGKTALDLLS
ncbi:MAG TPA: YunC family protein [Methanoregulaceae archaeon]|nr:YunC family protein [Methanoregulaceae archaeon]